MRNCRVHHPSQFYKRVRSLEGAVFAFSGRFAHLMFRLSKSSTCPVLDQVRIVDTWVRVEHNFETYLEHSRAWSKHTAIMVEIYLASVGHNRNRPSFVEHGRKILKQSSMVRKHRRGTSTWVYFIKRARHFYEVPDDLI